jgi:hypothetical protein
MSDFDGHAESQIPAGTRLDGWKEIASYLGRGVRTVQRWEREFGLPVRRMGADRGESVFAFTGEIDRWLARWEVSGEQRPAGDPSNGSELSKPFDSTEPDDEPDPLPAPAPPAAVRRWKRRAWIMAGLALLLAVRVVWREFSAPAGTAVQPAAVRLEVDSLVATDASGRRLWSYRFPYGLETAKSPYGSVPDIVVEDVDGDGQREVLAAIRSARSEDLARSGFYLFNADGTVRWTYRFDGSVRFGTTTYLAPWRARGTVLTPAPEDPARRALWAVSHERTDFPSVVQRLDLRTGRPLSHYWSNGNVESLAYASFQGRPVLLVGAANNEHMASSLAVLRATDPNGSAPAAAERYRCAACPPGAPVVFAVLPRPARFRSIDLTGCIQLIDVSNPREVVARAWHASGALLGSEAVGIYRLDGNLRPISVSIANGYQMVNEELTRLGRIPPLAPPRVDPAREFLPILHWAGNRFVEVR